jgi:hypothetical protein
VNCDASATAILEGVDSPELRGHLLRCPECRSLAQGHVAALALRGVELSLARPRLAPRLVVVVAALGLVVAAAIALRAETETPVSLVESPPGAVATSPVEQAPLTVGRRESDGSGEALTALRSEVAALSTADVTVADEAYRPFRAWPKWLAPSWAQTQEMASNQGESQ